MRYAIRLTLKRHDGVLSGDGGGFRAQIQADQPVGLDDAAVFAYLACSTAPGSPQQVGVFDHICTPTDLAEFPIGAPREDTVPPWFRMDVVDLVFRSRIEVLEFWDDVQDRVKLLVDACESQDRLDHAESVVISSTGISPAPDDSSSSSYNG